MCPFIIWQLNCSLIDILMKRKIFHLFSWFNGQFLLILFNNLSVIKYFRAWNIIFFLKKIDQCQLRTNTVAFDTMPTLGHDKPYSCLIKRLILHSPSFLSHFSEGDPSVGCQVKFPAWFTTFRRYFLPLPVFLPISYLRLITLQTPWSEPLLAFSHWFW